MHLIGLGLLFALGALIALVLLAIPIFLYSLARGRRAFHADGIVVRAEFVALDSDVGPRLAGPAIVRFSGAFHDEGASGTDVLGMSVRMRKPGDAHAREEDLTVGDQDCLFGTFESFRTASQDREHTDVSDYLGNQYSSVAVWRVDGLGAGKLRAIPVEPSPAGPTRVARLDAAIAAGKATFTIEARDTDEKPLRNIAELRLVERLPLRGRLLRISMFRNGRGLTPTGFRNGIRAVVYPMSQLARRIRGG
jgi:hypothetical protein